MLLAFGAGVMPETVLRWIGNKVSRLFGAAEQNDHVDLEHIHGISAFTRARLVEVGIYDAQGLVTNNPLRLSLHTPFSLPQIMDWHGQAFILLYFQPSGLDTLRKQGIRTIWELRAAWEHQAASPLPAAQATVGNGITLGDVIPRVLAILATNPIFVRASEIQDRMRESPPEVVVTMETRPAAA